MPRGPALRAALGAMVSLVALALVFLNVDLAKTADALRSADPRWIAFAWVLIVTDLAIRGLRWQRLVRPIQTVKYLHMEGYLLIGYLMNNILPARLGELVRSHYLGDREGISRVSALGTVVVERIVDLVVCVSIASASLLILSVRGVVASAVLVGIAVTGVFLVVLAVGIVAHRLPGADRIAALVDRWPRVRELGRRVQDGLAVAGKPRTLVEALLCSIASWSASILGFAAIGQSIGLELSIGQAALMTSGIALASAVPAGPSNLGTFEAAAVLIGQTIGIPSDQALAMAFIAHVSILLATSVGGGISLVRIGWQRSATSDEIDAVPLGTGPRETADAGGGQP